MTATVEPIVSPSSRARSKSAATCTNPTTVTMLAPDACALMAGSQHAVDKAALTDLIGSIRRVGQLHAIHVRSVGDRFEVISGRRRWLACQELGRDVAAIVHESCTDAEAAVLRQHENLQRQEPTAYDVAVSFRNAISTYGWTQAQVADRMAVSISTVHKHLRLLNNTSDALLTAVQQGLSLKVSLALAQLEAQIGEAAARPVIKKTAAGEYTSGDINAIRSRAEKHATGVAAVKPPAFEPIALFQRATKRLLKLLDEHPALVSEVPSLQSTLNTVTGAAVGG